jgi:hypothetical protein
MCSTQNRMARGRRRAESIIRDREGATPRSKREEKRLKKSFFAFSSRFRAFAVSLKWRISPARVGPRCAYE